MLELYAAYKTCHLFVHTLRCEIVLSTYNFYVWFLSSIIKHLEFMRLFYLGLGLTAVSELTYAAFEPVDVDEVYTVLS